VNGCFTIETNLNNVDTTHLLMHVCCTKTVNDWEGLEKGLRVNSSLWSIAHGEVITVLAYHEAPVTPY